MNRWRWTSNCRCLAFVILVFSYPLQTLAGVAPLQFSMSFTPATVGPDNITTLRYFLQNPQSAPAADIEFDNFLPADMRVADIPRVETDCTALIQAESGSGLIAVSQGQLGPGESCAIEVNVASTFTRTNTTGELISSLGSSGTASATLTIDLDLPMFTKTFNPSDVAVDTTSRLIFEIDNSGAKSDYDLASFVDGLPPGLVVATPANAFTNCDGGLFPPAIDAEPGSSTVSFTNGHFDAGESCKVELDVLATVAGKLDNVSESLIVANTTPVGKAEGSLNVLRQFLTKAFVDDPAAPGDIARLRFTLTNFDRTHAAENIAFTDDLSAMLSNARATNLPLTNLCGNGSTITGTNIVTFSGALAPEQTCSFDVLMQVPAGAPPGDYLNTTSTVSAEVQAESVLFPPATDTLAVRAKPRLTKSFASTAVPGGEVTLDFELTNTRFNQSLTDISFEDDLGAMLGGVVTTTADSGFCGPGSIMVRTGLDANILQVSGANLGADESCTFSVTLTVPADASGGRFLNRTSTVQGLLDGVAVSGNPAEAELIVLAAPQLQKSFVNDPVAPGESVNLEFTLAYGTNAVGDATAIGFTDDLSAVLSGLVATGGNQNNVCGPGSQLTGTTNLTLSDGSLSPGQSCTFSVSLDVPANAAAGAYRNQTSEVAATVQDTPVTGLPATDFLDIVELEFVSELQELQSLPGGETTLQFTITNRSQTNAATDLAFTNDFNDTLVGLASISPARADICGSGSAISGSGVITFSGGSLATGASCTFDVVLAIPGNASPGEYANQTGSLTGNVGAPISVPGAISLLNVVSPLSIQKEFLDLVVFPGDPVDLRFTLVNNSPFDTLSSIEFSDDLDAAMTGLVAEVLPSTAQCGVGSAITGSNLLTFSNGSLAPESSCQFDVRLRVPLGIAPGLYTNITSSVSGGGFTGPPATDQIRVEEPPPDLAIGITNGMEVLGNNTWVTYAVAVINVGIEQATGADVGVLFPTALTAITWTCETLSSAASCTPSGNGPIADTITLGAGARVDYRVRARVQGADMDTVKVDANVMAERDLNPANDTARDTDVIDVDLLMQGGFEPAETLDIVF